MSVRKLLALAAVSLFAAGALPSAAQNPPAGGNPNVMLILDASGSMWGQVEGRSKIEIAREVVGGVLRDIGPKVNLGIMTYGHRSKGDCKDIETVVPVGKVDADRSMAVIEKLNPKGKTPITEAVRRGAQELRYRENKATIILVSDGLETCAADPCVLAEELEKQGVDFTVHVVGFDLKKQDTRKLQCLADKTGGRYLSADSAGELGDAIDDVVARVEAKPPPPPKAPEPQATTLKVSVHLTEESPPLESAYVHVIPADANKDRTKAAARGSTGRLFKVGAGEYDVVTRYGDATGETAAKVEDGKTASAKIVLNAGHLSVKAAATEGAAPDEDAYIRLFAAAQQADGSRKQIASGNQRKLFTLPAGTYVATAQIGKATASQEVRIEAGKKREITIVVASGQLKVDALAEEGGKPIADAYIRIFEPEANANGQRSKVTAGVQSRIFTLPAGQYFVSATVGKATVGRMVEVAAAKKTEVAIVLGVGALKVTALPTAGVKPIRAYVRILEIEKQLDGSRKQIAAGTTSTVFKLPAGRYRVQSTAGKAVAEQDVEVTANKMAEVTLDLKAGSLKVNGDKSFYLTISAAEKNLDGSRRHITGGRPGQVIVLPAGKYFISGKAKNRTAEAEVEVTAGKLNEVELKGN